MTEYADISLREELETRFADAERRRQEEEFLSRGWQPPAGWQRVGQGLKHDLEDIGYGMKKALSGATLGASDWALRKLGITDDDYLAERETEGLGNYVKGAGFVSELGGNMLGAGGALVKNLGKAGLKGLKLASTAGGLEGVAYGLTGSDSLSDVPQNVAISAGFGAAMPVGMAGAGYVGSKLAAPFSSRINVPETIAAERARYGDYIAKHGADEVLDFAPKIKDINVYRGGDNKSVLKSMVRNLEKNNPDFKFRTMKDPETGRIYKDYDHLLSDPERSRYIHTFMDTYNNPQVVKTGVNNGYPRLYKYSVYNNPEHNNRVYDLISQSEKGKVLTKVAREGKHGKESLEKIVMPHAHQTSDAGRAASQSEMFPPYSSFNNIYKNRVVVNSELPNVSTLYEGLTPFQSGQLESRGSLIGNNLDRANNLLLGGAIRNASNNLMNPKFVGFPVESWFIRNPNLSAGLSAEVAKNYQK